MMMDLLRKVRGWFGGERYLPGTGEEYGGGGDALTLMSARGVEYSPANYGNYYATSVPVYGAIRLRSEAVSRPPLRVYRRELAGSDEGLTWVGPSHDAQRLLDTVNRHWSSGDLWRATETYLSLWGAAYWYLRLDAFGRATEIWPLRTDRVALIPDRDDYIRGYLYTSPTGAMQPLLPDEIVRFRYFNPLDDYAGFSPIAPVRLTVDMGYDALVSNRSGMQNDGVPGVAFTAAVAPTEEEIQRIYTQWADRYAGPRNARKPIVLGEGMSVENLGFSPRDMQYLQAMRWTVEDVARAYNVPKPLLHDLERATYANIETARRMFWETAVVPELNYFETVLNDSLLSRYGGDLVCAFDVSTIEALRESETELARRIEIYVRSGVMSIDEARALVGLPPQR